MSLVRFWQVKPATFCIPPQRIGSRHMLPPANHSDAVNKQCRVKLFIHAVMLNKLPVCPQCGIA